MTVDLKVAVVVVAVAEEVVVVAQDHHIHTQVRIQAIQAIAHTLMWVLVSVTIVITITILMLIMVTNQPKPAILKILNAYKKLRIEFTILKYLLVSWSV